MATTPEVQTICPCGCHTLNPGVEWCNLCLPNHPDVAMAMTTPAKSEAVHDAFLSFCEKHAINGAARVEVGRSTERIDDIVVTFLADDTIAHQLATITADLDALKRDCVNWNRTYLKAIQERDVARQEVESQEQRERHSYSDEICASPLAQRDLFQKQRDWLIQECARVGVTVNVAIGAPLETAYRLVNGLAINQDRKNTLIRRADALLHEIMDRDNLTVAEVKRLAADAHAAIHGLAGILSDDPQIREAAAKENS